MLNIYVANLGKYNEGELVGEWMELPLKEDEMRAILFEKVGINKQYEEWAIHDHESDIDGLEIGEYTDIFKLNELAEQIECLDESELLAVKAYIENGEDIENAIEKAEEGEYSIYYACNDMEDVAIEYVESTGMLSDVPDTIAGYFDYEALGRDMKIDGTFVCVDGNYVELY